MAFCCQVCGDVISLMASKGSCSLVEGAKEGSGQLRAWVHSCFRVVGADSSFPCDFMAEMRLYFSYRRGRSAVVVCVFYSLLSLFGRGRSGYTAEQSGCHAERHLSWKIPQIPAGCFLGTIAVKNRHDRVRLYRGDPPRRTTW